jgi:hypothetical protein
VLVNILINLYKSYPPCIISRFHKLLFYVAIYTDTRFITKTDADERNFFETQNIFILLYNLYGLHQ